jgi:hypothetical protein
MYTVHSRLASLDIMQSPHSEAESWSSAVSVTNFRNYVLCAEVSGSDGGEYKED